MATIKAGIYKFVNQPYFGNGVSFPSSTSTKHIEQIQFISNDVAFTSMGISNYVAGEFHFSYGKSSADTSGAGYTNADVIAGKVIEVYESEMGNPWTTVTGSSFGGKAEYQAIVIESDQTVSTDLYTWFTENAIKQIGDIPITTPDGVKLKTAGKYVTDDIKVIPTLEEKSVTPSTSQQVVEPSTGNCGLKKVTVAAVPTEEKTVTAGTSSSSVTPTSGKFLSKVTVNPTPTETADVTPSKGQQTVMPTSGKHFSSVVVEPIPDDYVIPSGTQQITENGTYDVSGKASAVVNVPSGVEEVATASAMNALLVEENVGKYYKFTGTTDDNFVNGDLYLVESGT